MFSMPKGDLAYEYNVHLKGILLWPKATRNLRPICTAAALYCGHIRPESLVFSASKMLFHCIHRQLEIGVFRATYFACLQWP